MSGDNAIAEIFPDETLQYAVDITCPWPLDRPIKASEVSEHLFTSNSSLDDQWNVPQIRQCLYKLASIGFEDLRLDDFTDFINDAEDGDDRRLRVQGLILILGRGSRAICRGLDRRYIYHYFDPIAGHIVKGIIGEGTRVHLSDWEAAGIDKSQAIVRMILLGEALSNSELLEDRELALSLLERLKEQYARLTHSRDTYVASAEKDSNDEFLLGRLLQEGPPRGRGVHMWEVVFWVVRLIRAKVAVVKRFGRDPESNVWVGREEGDGEGAWLGKMGMTRREEDEEVREAVKKDLGEGRWTQFDLH